MGAASFILAINLAVAGLFAAVFAWLSRHEMVREPASWLAGAFALGLLSFVAEAAIPNVGDPRLVVFAAFMFLLGALALFVVGVAVKYRVPIPWLAIILLVALSAPLNLMIYDMPRGSFARVLLYQLPYALAQLLAAWAILRAQARSVADWALFGFLLASALQFLAKPFLAVWLGPGATPQGYVSSTYALVSQSLGSVLLVAAGLLIVALLLRDVIAAAKVHSETDSLSGLLNRRGFEPHADHVARQVSARRMTACVVICDLDHFKRINDSLGHEAGDRVIAVFAAILRSAIGSGHVAGRIGGEEFAVILRGANLSLARLFAENVRSAISTTSIEGLPEGHVVTASFGVAPILPGDTLSAMLRRADSALYQAKKDGRDRVRVAQPDGLEDTQERRGGSRGTTPPVA